MTLMLRAISIPNLTLETTTVSVFLWHALTMSLVEGTCPVIVSGHYMKEGWGTGNHGPEPGNDMEPHEYGNEPGDVELRLPPK